MTETPGPAVYLLHLDPPYRHARHYLGWTGLETIGDRIARHQDGRGAVLLQVQVAAGGTWRIARVWRCASWREARAKERTLKRQGGRARICPICRAQE